MPAKLPVARVGSNEEILRAEGEKSPFRGGLVGRNVAAAQERLVVEHRGLQVLQVYSISASVFVLLY